MSCGDIYTLSESRTTAARRLREGKPALLTMAQNPHRHPAPPHTAFTAVPSVRTLPNSAPPHCDFDTGSHRSPSRTCSDRAGEGIFPVPIGCAHSLPPLAPFTADFSPNAVSTKKCFPS